MLPFELNEVLELQQNQKIRQRIRGLNTHQVRSPDLLCNQ